MNIRYELQFALRQPVILIVYLTSVLFSLLIGLGVTNPDISALQQLELNMVTLHMMVIPPIVAVIAPVILLRDTNANMSELIWVTPVRSDLRWLGRSLATVAVTGLAFSLCTLFLLMAFSINVSFEITMLFTLIKHVMYFALPTILLLTVIVLWLCLSFSNNAIIYLVFGAIWMGYIMLASSNGSPVLAGSQIVSDSLYSVMLRADPYALTALVDVNTLSEADTFTYLLMNRLGYSFLALFCLYLLISKKQKPDQARNSTTIKTPFINSSLGLFFKKIGLPKKHSAGKHAVEIEQLDQILSLKDSPKLTSTKTRYVFSNDVSALYTRYLKSLVLNKLNLILFMVWTGLCFENVASGLGITDTFSQYLPNSIDALNRIAFDLLPAFGTAICAFWAWQIGTYDKRHGFSELLAATPTQNSTIVLVHLAAITSLLAILLVCSAIGSLAAETLLDSKILLSHYMTQFWISGTQLLLISWLFVACFHMFKQTLVAMGVVTAILVVKFTPVMNLLGLAHPLWDIASAPVLAPDSFWYFSSSITSFKPYISFWFTFVITSILLATKKTHRLTGFSSQPFGSQNKWLALPIGGVILFGFLLSNQVWQERPLANASKREHWKADYEKHYQNWQNIPQPKLIHLEAKVDIYSRNGHANFDLTYYVTNTHSESIKDLLIGRYGNYELPEIEIKDAQPTSVDLTLGQTTFKLDSPLEPGETLSFTTRFSVESDQLWVETLNQAIKPEFSNLIGIPLLPTIGYQSRNELTDTQLRAKYNLSPKPTWKPSTNLIHGASERDDYNWITMNTQLSVDHGSRGLTQGKLIKSWQQGDRAYYKYEALAPFRAIPVWSAVPFKAQSAMVNNTEISVLTQHNNEAVKLNLKAMQDTLAWFEENVVAYPYTQLTLVNTPDLEASGYALPQIMYIADTVGFRSSPLSTAGFDQRYRRAVHETAHQWFGHNIGNGVKGDSLFLVESLAKYVELVLIEKHYGYEAMNALVEYEQKRFDFAEVHNYEQPNALVDADKYHEQYSKATLVFAELRNTVGDKAITTALKEMWKRHQYPKTPATSMDFVRYLKFVSPNHKDKIDSLLLTP
ncbi:M1 family aminopeptidase [Alteromonas facilis]|uniref:M1 family aminopeptidase n=1 Tax=Alteromonas facilis TaxID=2048004 RepID=UPI000C287798|nr:M1 family aminopeptidase [Alteromonas facilis]